MMMGRKPAGGGGGAPPEVEAVASAVSGGATSLSVTKPAGSVSGDLLVAQVGLRNNDAVTATGWTPIFTTTNPSGGFIRHAVFYKVAGGSEPASYSFSWTTSQKATAGIARISGANASPIDAWATTEVSATLTADSITTTVAGCLLLFFAALGDNGTYTPPSGMTERWDRATSNFNDLASTMASETLGAAGATGSRTGSYTISLDGSAALVAIAPA